MLQPLNFFGHAVVASWMNRDPRFVLGAMLPDFASMCGTRIDSIDCPTLEAGIGIHYRTDAIFHEQPWFTLRQRRLTRRLLEHGVRRGPALGAGHVGIEIALDAALAADRRDGGCYAIALETASEAPRWTFADGGATIRFADLIARLGSAPTTTDADTIVERVRRTLERRPLLALRRDEVPRLHSVLTDEIEDVAESYEDLLAALSNALL